MANILWIIHGYPPQQNAGAEFMAKEINDFLESNGHEVDISLGLLPSKDGGKIGGWSDVIFTHLDLSQDVTSDSLNWSKPVFNVIHHNWEIPHLRPPNDNVYCVYNSEWVAKDRNYPHESCIVRPPVNPDRFDGVKYNPKGYITLVNCNKDKGALIFQQIARSCPDLKFLAVKGAHGQQLELRGKNITQWECQDDIRKVLEQTSMLLVPSIYESYGRIAVEAMACGIPVIATNTPGLKESLGSAGKFATRNFIPGWLQCIRSTKREFHLDGYLRAQELWSRSVKELEVLNNLILSSIKK